MNSKLIVGSTALAHWLPDSVDYRKEPKDLDYISNLINSPMYLDTRYIEQVPNFIYKNFSANIEYLIVDNCTPLQKVIELNNDSTYIDLENLLLIKNAHKHFYRGNYSKSFKHLLDYSYLLKFTSLDNYRKQLSVEYRNWLIEYAYFNDPRLLKVPSLDKTKQEFFNYKVKYFIDHDYLHEIFAIESQPAYTKCLTSEVAFSNSIFNSLDYISKVNMVLEESFVLASERCLIPLFKGISQLPAYSPSEAFKYALVRVATNIASGPFRDFAADNFIDIYNYFLKYHSNFYEKIIKLF